MKRFLYILSLLALVACHPSVNPTPSTGFASSFTSGVIEYYGSYYLPDGLPNNVAALDLYSDGLSVNSKGYMEGSGTNIYFSDIFFAPSSAVFRASHLNGTYQPDTTGAVGTYLPGTYYEGNFTGAYLLLIEEGKLTGYTLLSDGSLVVRSTADSSWVDFSGKTMAGRAYEAHYAGKTLRLDDRTGSSQPRSAHFLR